MSGVVSRVIPRLLASLRPQVRMPSVTRSISSFQGLQGLVQPWKVAALEEGEVVEAQEMDLHLEAMQQWHDEAEKMRDIRVLPLGFEDQVDLEATTRHQVTEMLNTLLDEDVLDIRRGWMGTTSH